MRNGVLVHRDRHLISFHHRKNTERFNTLITYVAALAKPRFNKHFSEHPDNFIKTTLIFL